MGLNDLAEDKEPKTWREKAEEAGLDEEPVKQVNEFSDTRTGRILSSASKGRDMPPSPERGWNDPDEKPCPACACISPKASDIEDVDEVLGYKCINGNCGVGYFRNGWNEFRTEESFLSGVEVTGWRLE